jgi:MFS family permease
VTLIGIGSLVTNIPASIITTRYGERWAIVGAAIWGALAIVLCVLVQNIWVFAAGIFMVGMASAVFGLARQSYLTEVVPFHYRARALSTLGGVMRIGLFVGPFVAAGLIHLMGIGGAYWAGAGALVLAAVVAWRMPDLPAPRARGTRRRRPAGPRRPDAALGRRRPHAPLPHARPRRAAHQRACARRARR